MWYLNLGQCFALDACLYCGQLGSLCRHLPFTGKRPGSSAEVGMLASSVSACGVSSRLVVLLWRNSLLPVPFLIDSGTDDSFLDESLARQASPPQVELAETHTVQGLNGRTLALATHRIASLTLLVNKFTCLLSCGVSGGSGVSLPGHPQTLD